MRLILLLFFLLCISITKAQSNDSIYYELQAVEIKNIFKSSAMRLLSSESFIDREQLNQHPPYSMVSAINGVPGVRMEERSPGSYRLSIRGSLLRSPFGVRNVKIYIGDFPFTDAGGNTYLNSLDMANINSIRILKGPEASIFGANTGGVLLIDPVQKTNDSIKTGFSISGGSYGLLYENVFLQKRWKKVSLNIQQGFQKSDGYRKNSAMDRQFLQASSTFYYKPNAEFSAMLLLSELNYRTPGGLTLQQYNEHPENARLATAKLPGAIEQHAGVYNRTIFGGLSHKIRLTKNLKHAVSIFGSNTDFRNPFITNYETRMEHSYGLRTHVDATIFNSKKISGRLNLGGEWQQTNTRISNHENNKGMKDSLFAADEITAQQSFLFARFLTDIGQRFLTEISVSYNFFNYRYRNNYPFGDAAFKRRNFNPRVMPRIAFSYSISSNLSWRASVSGGYSPPTIAEVRSSNNIVSTSLQAEKGQNYETGLRFRDRKDIIWVDASVFYYTLQDAIVRRTDTAGNEYFINAGGTRQKGLEAQLSVWLIRPRKHHFIRAVQLSGNITLNRFTFTDYIVNKVDYSGNKLTGVPDYTSVETMRIELPYQISFYSQYYYADNIPLNDGNTVRAKSYHLLQVKAEWKKVFKTFNITLFAGIDNLLNQKYSLGNDLNAAGERYYNAASLRNYYGGIKVVF